MFSIVSDISWIRITNWLMVAAIIYIIYTFLTKHDE